MHRHGYKGRKLGREEGQRKSLIKNLAESLILHESIETTRPKAKELVPYVEKLITKAKLQTLHSRRQVISSLYTKSAANKLINEIAPKYSDRVSGHLTTKRTTLRVGDNAQLVNVSFVSLSSTESQKTKSGQAQQSKSKPKTPAKETKA